MGVRETPSFATSGSSDIRSPGANSPRISDSRRLNRARAAWEATSEKIGRAGAPDASSSDVFDI